VLTKALDDDDISVRGSAAYVLGEMGSAAKSALPQLEKMAEKDPDEVVRQVVQEAIPKIEKT
jgi:HEAT repeat protein